MSNLACTCLVHKEAAKAAGKSKCGTMIRTYADVHAGAVVGVAKLTFTMLCLICVASLS